MRKSAKVVPQPVTQVLSEASSSPVSPRAPKDTHTGETSLWRASVVRRLYEVWEGNVTHALRAHVTLYSKSPLSAAATFTLLNAHAILLIAFVIGASHRPVAAAFALAVQLAMNCLLVRCVVTDPGMLPKRPNDQQYATVQSEGDEADCEAPVAARVLAADGAAPVLPAARLMDLNEKRRVLVVQGRVLEIKYCHTCQVFRPPRSGHCSACDCCVQRQDHHCPWLGVCVARRNHIAFFAFCVAMVTLSAMGVAYPIADCVAAGTQSAVSVKHWLRDNAVTAATCVYSVALFVFQGLLLAYQVYVIATNQTVKESIKQTAKRSLYANTRVWRNVRAFFAMPHVRALVDFRQLIRLVTRDACASGGTPVVGAITANGTGGGGIVVARNTNTANACGAPQTNAVTSPCAAEEARVRVTVAAFTTPAAQNTNHGEYDRAAVLQTRPREAHHSLASPCATNVKQQDKSYETEEDNIHVMSPKSSNYFVHEECNEFSCDPNGVVRGNRHHNDSSLIEDNQQTIRQMMNSAVASQKRDGDLLKRFSASAQSGAQQDTFRDGRAITEGDTARDVLKSGRHSSMLLGRTNADYAPEPDEYATRGGVTTASNRQLFDVADTKEWSAHKNLKNITYTGNV